MKPLLYLTLNQVKNGAIRAASSPKRLISFLFFVGYYFFVFWRPTMWGGNSPELPPRAVGLLEFPPMQVVEALLFAGFAVASLLLMLGAGAQQAAFKPADVDMLFPTPISPRIVLMFRIVRDYFLTLIMPLLFVLLGFRPAQKGFDALFRNFPNPNYGTMTLRAASFGWVLIAMLWILIGYAISLFVNRSDRASDWNKKALYWGFSLMAIGFVAYVGIRAQSLPDLPSWIGFSRDAVVRILAFPATFALWITMAPLAGKWLMGGIGLLAMGGISLTALRIALSQSDWMYDQAAVRGFQTDQIRTLQRSGDMLGMAAAIARTKRGKAVFKSNSWWHRLKMIGVRALIWKEALLIWRGMRIILVMNFALMIVLTATGVLMPNGRDGRSPAVFLFFVQFATVLGFSMPLAQVGFIEWLRRVDLIKPLPFSSASVALAEVSMKSLLATIASFVAAVATVIVKPHLYAECITMVLMAGAFSLVTCSTVLLATVLFPDIEDATQGQFRGLVTMLTVLIFGSIPVGMFFVFWLLFALHPLVASIVPILLSAVITWGLCKLSGRLYEGYNPSE